MRPDTRLPDDVTADPADTAEQDRPADPTRDERLPTDLPTGVDDADPADVLDQYRDATQDEEER